MKDKLEKILEQVDPMRLHAAATNEYEDEIDMFLGRVDDTTGEEELIDILHGVFQEMFNDDTSSASREKYRPVIREYLFLLNSAKNGGNIHH
jgi:hypothetical protein